MPGASRLNYFLLFRSQCYDRSTTWFCLSFYHVTMQLVSVVISAVVAHVRCD